MMQHAVGAWCSGLAYLPVKEEIAGSNPVAPAGVKQPVSVSRETKILAESKI